MTEHTKTGWYARLIEALPYRLSVPLDRIAVKVIRPVSILLRKAGITKTGPTKVITEEVDIHDLPDDVKAELGRAIMEGLGTAKRVKLPRPRSHNRKRTMREIEKFPHAVDGGEVCIYCGIHWSRVGLQSCPERIYAAWVEQRYQITALLDGDEPRGELGPLAIRVRDFATRIQLNALESLALACRAHGERLCAIRKNTLTRKKNRR